MGIYVRRGMEADFDPEKMKPGEWAVSINSDRKKQKIWMCFAPGVVKRMGTYEDFVDQIENATDEIKQKYITAFNEILKQIEDDKNVVDEEYQYIVSFKKAIDNTYIPQITAYANAAASSAKSAATSESNANTYKTNAASSASAAASSAKSAATSESNANTYKTNAASSASAAASSAKLAATSESNANTYKTNAASSASAAASSAKSAATSESNANTYKTNAASSANTAETARTAAETYKNNAQTYMNNAKSYMDAAKTAAASITGALKPKGTVTFANLPNISSVESGAMYNISTAFTSVEKLFKDGGKIQYPAGTNVYKTEDGMWDCLGGELSDYLMKADIDTAVEEAMPDYTTSSSLQELVSGESVKSALGKIKTAVKNVITIVKLLGNTDISKIGNGTVTGAISKNATTINNVINKQATDLKSTNTKIDEVTTTAAANKKLLGSTSISSIGNGTVTDAISTLNSNFGNISQKIYSKDLEAVTVDISNKTRLKISFVTEHGFCLVFGEANHTAFGYIVTYTDCIELKGGYKTERYGNTWMITLGNWATATIIRGSIAGMVVDVD
jgi:hypothetical protein